MGRHFGAAFAALVLAALGAGRAGGQQALVASYLGGAGDDCFHAAVMLADGTALVAGVMPGATPETDRAVESVAGEGDGVVVRLSKSGHKVEAIRRFGGAVTDMDADGAGHVYVVGAFGSAKLDPATMQAIWTEEVGGADGRVAAGPRGAAVVLAGQSVTLLDGYGQRLRSWRVGSGFVNDVAYHTGTGYVCVTGFYNRRGQVPGENPNPVQVAYVYAYDGGGEKVWTAYDWPGQEVANRALMADTRGYRLAVGADGYLYVAGESAGGNTMWARKSNNLDEELPLAGTDIYQRPRKTAANHITFVGRIHPRTGVTLAGTMLLARMENGRGNTIRPRALAADSGGRVYVGGTSAEGMPVMRGAFGRATTASGAWFCVFDASFEKRLVFSRPCDGTVLGMALGRRGTVLAGETKGDLPQVRALQRKAGGGETDGWLAVFSP